MSATLTPTTGNPRTKFVVPSIGSTTHIRSAMAPPPSSARIAMSGAPSWSTRMAARSAARSISVT